jgi:hypothetical protein
MKLLLHILFLAAVAATTAEEVAVTVLASLDPDRIAESGMKVEEKKDMPDFTLTYLRGPTTTDVVGVYEGGHPSPFSGRGKRLGEIKDGIAGQEVVWVCWTETVDGRTQYGAEALLQSRRTVVRFEKKEEEFVTQFHVFVIRGDLKALAEARKLAARIIKRGPIQTPEPMSGLAPGHGSS